MMPGYNPYMNPYGYYHGYAYPPQPPQNIE